MRKLKTKDAPAFIRVLSEAGIRTEVRAIAERAKANGAGVKAEDVGWEIILACLERLSEKGAEALLYEFIAGPLELPAEEIGEMDLDAFAETLTTWWRDYTSPEAVRRFFAFVSGLMATAQPSET